LNLGISTPFLNITQSFHYFNLQNAKESMSRIGKLFEYEGFPAEICPLIFGVTSRGRCAQGVNEILEILPTQIVSPEDLEGIMATKDDPSHRNVIYLVTFDQKHMVEHKSGKPFDKEEYYAKPSDFKGVFASKYLKYVSILFHAMYWVTFLSESKSITNLGLQIPNHHHRLRNPRPCASEAAQTPGGGGHHLRSRGKH
jgi:alpha-aminoadipic semialdehyde synthase